MQNKQSETEFENSRLNETISLVEHQLEAAHRFNEKNKEAILEAKKEMRENTPHSIGNLWGAEAFEALAALNQYANPINEKIESYEEIEKKISILERMIKSPYFARINFKFEGEEDYEKIYIGRSSLKKEDTREIFVYDWRSPIASVFYRFVTGQVFYDAPAGRIEGDVNLKRQYEIVGGRLEYFFDADVQIVDEFLRKMLSHNTTSKMKTIVETIQRDQDIVIRDMENDLMMVQGVAGSGKTSIALHRAAYLMYQGLAGNLSANNIIIISPNTLFEQYISGVLPELGENNVISAVFEELLGKLLPGERIQSRNQFLERLLTDTPRHHVIKRSIELKNSEQFKRILDRFIEELPDRWISFEDVYHGGKCIIKKESLQSKVQKRRQVPLGMRLEQLEDFVLEQIGGSGKTRIGKQEGDAVRKELQQFTKLNLRKLYRILFSDRKYFYSLADGIIPAGAIDDIYRFTQRNLAAPFFYYDDTSALAYLKLKLYGTGKYKNIRQVVIDEAQDYYPLQYEIFNLLFSGAQFTVLGDMNQTLEKQEDLSLYDRIAKILNKKRISLVTMDKSFRCTNEILNYSLKFIEEKPEIKSFNRSGAVPRVFAEPDLFSLCSRMIEEIERCREAGCGSIGLICKTERNARSLYQDLKDRIKITLITNNSTSEPQGIFIIPVYMSKGLEFDAVLICDADNNQYCSEEDKKLLYIASTRALHRLNIFCIGEASEMI